MSQTAFGKQLGVSRSVIKNIELNALAKPDQKIPLLKLICKEFSVNEEWLINGTGSAFAQEKIYTTKDIYSLPEGERAELIDGQLYMMAPPNTIHQRISHLLAWKIENYIQSKKGKCEVFAAPFAVFLNKDDRNYVEPDISVICDKNKINDKGCDGAPDWIIEIASPSSTRMDYAIKLFKYRTGGVREYWIVNPMKYILSRVMKTLISLFLMMKYQFIYLKT